MTRAFLPILAVLYILGFTNLFLRTTFGVLAPELEREMALSPALLSTIASSYFVAYAVMQVPTGMLLDRYGPRRTLSVMLVFTMIGTALFAAGRSVEALTAARLLMGFGCAGIFTGAFYVLAVQLPADRVVTQIGALNSFAALGNLCATAPLAALIALIGWRESFWLFAAAIGVVTLAVALIVRDVEDEKSASDARSEPLSKVMAGVREAVAQPGMVRLLFAGLPMSASSTISGAWGAPYLKHVHGLDNIGRGNVLLLMAVCGMCGHFLYGQIARRLNTLKWPILGGSLIILATTSCFALLSRPPIWLVAVLFGVLSISSAYPTVCHSHARGLVPRHLMGRGVAVTNMGIMSAIAGTQFAFGWILGAFVPIVDVPPEIAYRVAFAGQALLALIGIAVYAPTPDVKPRG